MGGQQDTKVDGIDEQRVTAAGDSGRRARIAVRYTKAAAFVIDEAVEGNLSLRTEIELYGVCSRQLFQAFDAAFGMKLLRYAVDRPVVNAVLPGAPFQSLPVQIANFRSLMLLNTRSTRKFSFTKRTRRSTFPFVNGCRGLQSFVSKPTVFMNVS